MAAASRPRSIALRASRPAPTITDGLEVLVQLVIAAITTRPWSSSTTVPSSRVTWTASSLQRQRVAVVPPVTAGRGRSPSRSWSSAGGSEAGNDSSPGLVEVAQLLGGLGVELLHRLEERLLRLRQRHPVLRPFRAGDAGLDVAEVELERSPRRPGPRSRRRRTSPARGRRRRRARSSRSGGRSARGSGASRRRPGRSRRSSRTRATCSRSSPGRRGRGSPARARRTRRISRRRRGRAASRSRSGPGRWRSRPRGARRRGGSRPPAAAASRSAARASPPRPRSRRRPSRGRRGR